MFELSQHVEIARTSWQTGSGHIPLRYIALRPASELDSVMEFGLRHVHDVHTQVFVQLASSSRSGRRPALELVADLLASWSQTCSRAGLRAGRRPAR